MDYGLFYGQKMQILIYLESFSFKFTVEKRKSSCKQNFDTFVPVLNFLDVSIILHQNSRSETDILYKETNSHDCLNYFSHQPEHMK